LKAEPIAIIILATCIFLSFYLSFLSFQTIDDTLKKQLVTLAAYTLISGVTILATLIIHLAIKKAFSRYQIKIRDNEEPTEQDET
jgi:hypothetical protein